MKSFLEKFSSYNFFNYLLPGVLYVLLASATTRFNLKQNDIVLGLFLYYFIGLVVSRIGSLILEPIFKKLGVVKFADYKDFVRAQVKDSSIDVLSEANNMYRTLSALFLMLLLTKGYDWLLSTFPRIEGLSFKVLLLLAFSLFIFSYRKQSHYITRRIKTHIKDKA